MSEDNSRPLVSASSDKRFVFAHKLFTHASIRFEKDGRTGEPVLKINLGDVSAAMTFATIRKNFGISPDTADSKVLDDVAKALQYVNQVKPGDAIPSELLTGAASWSVEPHHAKIARGRIVASLLSFLGESGAPKSGIELAALAGDEMAKARIQGAFGKLAERLNLPSGRRGEVIELFDRLCEELAYIEFLRDKIQRIRLSFEKVKALKTVFKKDRSVFENISRISHLLERPIRSYEHRILEVDAQTGEVSNVVCNIDSQIVFIRAARDWLHSELIYWDKNVIAWPDDANQSHKDLQNNIASLYRFAARYFPIVQEWGHS